MTLIWFALTVVGAMAIVRAAGDTIDRGHAQFAADAVVLAHLDHGAQRARWLADRLGASIESVTREGSVLTVVVRTDRHRATASAR